MHKVMALQQIGIQDLFRPKSMQAKGADCYPFDGEVYIRVKQSQIPKTNRNRLWQRTSGFIPFFKHSIPEQVGWTMASFASLPGELAVEAVEKPRCGFLFNTQKKMALWKAQNWRSPCAEGLGGPESLHSGTVKTFSTVSLAQTARTWQLHSGNQEGAFMKKQESEKAIRHLCSVWAKLRGTQISPREQPHFMDFLAWLQQNHNQYLNFRTTLSVTDQVEAWFDDEFKQKWRNWR